MLENLPKSVQYLDDDLVTPNPQAFFERKTEEAKKLALVRSMAAKNDCDLTSLDLRHSERELLQRFVRAGVVKDESTAFKWCEEAL